MTKLLSSITLREIVYNEAGSSYTIPAHKHNFYQWYCVVYGSVFTTIGDVTYSLGPYESVVIPPGMTRQPRCREKPPGYIYVLFENHSLSLDILNNKVLTTPAELHFDLASLVRELHHPGTNTYELVEALVVRLLIGLEREVQNRHQSSKGSTPLNKLSNQSIVHRVEAFMERNFQRPLTRAEIAEVVHISPTHLARLYRNATGITLKERLVELRVSSAKQLLLDSTLPVSEIGLQVGYSSFSHFSQLFRQNVGVSPSDYRRSEGNVWRQLDI